MQNPNPSPPDDRDVGDRLIDWLQGALREAPGRTRDFLFEPCFGVWDLYAVGVLLALGMGPKSPPWYALPFAIGVWFGVRWLGTRRSK